MNTVNLQNTMSWAGPFLNYIPLTIGGQEPALTNANLVLQTILGPPFCWRWNRATATFVCVAGTQDYTQLVADFGFIEKVTAQSADGKNIFELSNKTVLSASKESGRPSLIASQSDDGAGNIGFRLMPVPEQAHTITITYQRKPTLMNSIASLWTPIPDECGYIYQWGFLALASILANDSRFPIFNQRFISHLLGAQDGIDEMQRNIFLGNWLDITKAAERAQLKTQQGIAARQQ